MRLNILASKFVLGLEVENIVLYNNGKTFLELSTTNHDAYRITCNNINKNQEEGFCKDCRNMIKEWFNGRGSFTLTLEAYDVKLEKSSISSHID